MEGTGLKRVYQNEYTVFQRDAMYCFFKGNVLKEKVSLEEAWNLGGQFLFCPAVVENPVPFMKNAENWMKRRNRKPRWIWVSNPEALYSFWQVGILEDAIGGQSLFLEGYIFHLEERSKLSIENDETFVFGFQNPAGYSFGYQNDAMKGSDCELRLGTIGATCGTFTGNVEVKAEGKAGFMKKLNAGMYYARIQNDTEKDARKNGFIASVYNYVLKEQTDVVKIEMTLTPQALLDTTRTQFRLEYNQFSSNFAMNTGKSVILEAQQDAALVFQRRPVLAYQKEGFDISTRKQLYLGVSGSFVMKTNNGRLLCGLSGTETVSASENGKILFVPGNPSVFPLDDASLGETSWIGFSTVGAYYCQPAPATLYAPVQNMLRYLEVPNATIQSDVALPIFPFREIAIETEDDIWAVEQKLYTKRRQILLGENNLTEVSKITEPTTGATPQGMLVEVAPSGAYNKITLAKVEGKTGIQDLSFCSVDDDMKQSFQQKELLYIIEDPQELKKAAPSPGFIFAVEDIEFLLNPENWRTGDSRSTMLIIQYAAQQPLKEQQETHPALQAAIKRAYTNTGEIKPGYEPFIEAVEDKEFKGILALNVKVTLSELPMEVRFLMNSVDPDDFFAEYLIIKAGKLMDDANGFRLEPSKVSGLVDYSSEEKLSYKKKPPTYDYLTTEIRIQILENRLVTFTSSSEILLNRIFEAPATATANEDGNCLILEGNLVEKDGQKSYQYKLKHNVAYDLAGSGIEKVWIQNLDLTVGTEEGLFSMSGIISCYKLEEADLLGYGSSEDQKGLPFFQLVLRMKNKANAEKSDAFRMDYGLLKLGGTGAATRHNSLQERFAVTLDSLMVETDGKSPESKGYISITAPIQQGVPAASYQGFVWKIPVGSLGKLSDESGIELQFLTAFWPDEEGNTAYYIGVKLPAVLSGEKLKLEGIFKMGFGSVTLEKHEEGEAENPEIYYLFRLHNFHVEVLGTSFPKGSNDIILFSDGANVGWYAAYVKEEKDGGSDRIYVASRTGSDESY